MNTKRALLLPMTCLLLGNLFTTTCFAETEQKPRARDLGIPFEGKTGPLNAITDVQGLEVGHKTVIEGDHIRTGVTSIFPLGKANPRGVRAAISTINGTGEVTGAHMVKELGVMFGPVMLTNTWGVGTVRNGYLKWVKSNQPEGLRPLFSLPVIAETSDEGLNDIYGMHLTEAHAQAALNAAAPGPVVEGSVGGGTGMQAYGFKGGIGTASRQIVIEDQTYTFGVLVQANHGDMKNLRIAGVPAGKLLMDQANKDTKRGSDVKNSLIVVIATDLPFRADQLERLARRGALGLGRTGAVGTNVSGDFVIAFSTANPTTFEARETTNHIAFSAFADMDVIFQATVEAVEEALINQLIASKDMTANGITVKGIPHKALQKVLAERGALNTSAK